MISAESQLMPHYRSKRAFFILSWLKKLKMMMLGLGRWWGFYRPGIMG